MWNCIGEEGGDKKMAKEDPRVWAKMESVAWKKRSSPSFTCFLSEQQECYLLLVVQWVSLWLSRNSELMRQMDYLRGDHLSLGLTV